MTPGLLLALIASMLLATFPVRRLHAAGWTPGALLTAWVVYAAGIALSVDAGLGARYLVPLLIVLYVLPFAAGQHRPERAGRLLGAQSPVPAARPVINVTPGDPSAPTPDPATPKPRRGRKPPVEYR